ncbi:MAG TPA: urease accessory protein UreF [Methylophilaceae bacterium]|nr:urease accessory protein UreF [Methylophilaceae bacterium]
MPETLAANRLALSRLLQLASTMLPVGAYSYSQGLEWTIEFGQVHDAATTRIWVAEVLEIYQANFELPVLYRLYQAWQVGDDAKVSEWDMFYKAGRDTAESLAETRQMGYSLCRLLNDLQELPQDFMDKLNSLDAPAFPAAYAGVAYTWGVSAQDMLHAYVWSWLENQVAAAMKTVPLGQVAGQKIMLALGEQLPQIVEQAMRLEEYEISNFAPGLTIAGCLHETQYSRLFRS